MPFVFDPNLTNFENLSDAGLTNNQIEGNQAFIDGLNNLSADIVRGLIEAGTSHYRWLKDNGLTTAAIDDNEALRRELENLESDLVLELISAAKALRGEGGGPLGAQ